MTAEDYILEIKWCPTFHATSIWIVTRCEGATTLSVQIEASARTPAYTTILPVSSILAESLYQTVCYVVSRDTKNTETMARDGIILYGSLVSDSFSADAFEYWSPRSEQLPHRLVELLFSLVPLETTGMTLASYMRSLRRYFDFDRSPF
ncbi:MAG: hypothetical protein AAGB19_05005 [Cyanobacteria bacterium P01_F01_bin.3]